ncbi:MAG: hypothetical protein EXS58_09680 [Candidatus Latescibacteria bacterium]|nr:hypothetical protein [Candidatus Latescibacterota bacterium]
MKNRALIWVVVLLGLASLMGRASALEIYRIGGESLPAPQEPGVNFHQLSWGDFKEKQGLDEQALSQEGVLRPIFITKDDNIALTSVARGGGPYVRVGGVYSYAVTEDAKTMVDANPTTFREWVATATSDEEKFSGRAVTQINRVTIDLGGLFFVNRVRLYTPIDQSGHYPDKLDVLANAKGVQILDDLSGYGAAVGVGERVYRLSENVHDTIDVSFPLALARSVTLLIARVSSKAVNLAETEIYGEGYINGAAYASNFIDLKDPAIWGDIRWGGQKDAEAKVWIQSRAGKDLEPNVYWRYTGRGTEISQFDALGKPLNATAYALLKPGEAAQVTYDTQNWSFWSAPYDFAASSGTPVLSPGPNSVIQLRVDFHPTLNEGGEVNFIEFKATKPPLAEEVLGEVYPPEVPLGETAQLTYAIRPTIRSQHSGFDQVEIATPFGVTGIDAVRIGGVPVAYTAQITPDSSRFTIHLPNHLRSVDSGGVVEVVFRAPVLRYSTSFDGWVRDTERPLELAQRVNPGDAASELASEVLSVRTTFSGRLLDQVQVSPRLFTPNGDGVNDAAVFSFNLLQVTDAVPLKLEIYDLSGRRWRVVHDGLQQSGRFSFPWDGLDDTGGRVPPGVYLYRVGVKAEKGEAQQGGTVAVVY